jgi:hypothetical protein
MRRCLLQGMRDARLRRSRVGHRNTRGTMLNAQPSLVQRLSIHGHTGAAAGSVGGIAFTGGAFTGLCQDHLCVRSCQKCSFTGGGTSGWGESRGDCRMLRHTHTQEQSRPPN